MSFSVPSSAGTKDPAPVGLIAAVYALALILFTWRYLCAPVANENVMTAFMAQGLMQGEFPFFFYGQNWMGGYEAFILGPILALTGPSPWALNLISPLVSLAGLMVVHRILARFFSGAGVAAGLVFMAIPPATALWWVGYANVHYPLAVFLGAVLILITCRLWESDEWGFADTLGWGLIAGAAFYTNFQSVVFIAPAGLFLLFTRPKNLLLSKAVLLLPLGFLIGAGPFFYYNYTHGWTHLTQAGSGSLAALLPNLKALFYNALPMCLGFNTVASGGSLGPGSGLIAPYLILLGCMIIGLVILLWMARQRRMRALMLPVGIGLFNIGILAATGYGNRLSSGLLAYLLPFIWLTLPFVWAAMGQALARRSWWPTALLILVVAGNNAAAYAGFDRKPYRLLFTSGQNRQIIDSRRNIGRELRQAGFHHVYTTIDSPILSFLAGGDPIFADLWGERYADNSFEVDAAPGAVFWTKKVKNSLQMLGLDYETKTVAGSPVFHNFELPGPVDRLLWSRDWQARANSGKDLGPALNDGVFAPAFSTGGPAKPGQGFVLDLGREMDISGVSLIAGSFHETPAGLKLEGALADGEYFTLRQAREYWGPFYLSGPHPVLKVRHPRLECYFPATRVRRLRFSHLGPSAGIWSVTELLLWGPGQRANQDLDWAAAGSNLVSLLKTRRPRKVFADTWPAAMAKVHLGPKIEATTGNTVMDNFGDQGWDYWGSLVLEPGQGRSVLVRQRQAGSIQGCLSRAGIEFKRHDSGPMSLFMLQGRSIGPKLPLEAASSALDPAMARSLATGLDQGRRWAARRAQRPGDQLTLDMGRRVEMAWVELSSPDFPGDYARGLKALVSDDGENWREASVHFSGPWCFTGQVLLQRPGPVNLYRLARPVQGRYLKLVCTGQDPAYWWSVQKVRIFAPDRDSSASTPSPWKKQ